MNVRKPIDYSDMFKALDMLMSAALPQMEQYREIGKLVSFRPEKGAAAEYLGKTYPDVSGFSPRNLRRMRDFYRAYQDAPEVMRMAQKKLPGHFCKVCRMRKSNESFSGKGHAAHIVGAKSALFRFRLRRLGSRWRLCRLTDAAHPLRVKLHAAPLPLLSPRDPLRWARAGPLRCAA